MPNSGSRLTNRRWAQIAILLLAFALRLYRLGAESLWYDETVSVHLAGKSLPDLIAHTAGDIHPPGYYLLLQGWTRLAGSSDWAAAFLSLFFGVLLVALAAWLGMRLFGPRVGLLAALLVAVSPYNLWYSQEVRMYTLGAALGLGVLAVTIEATSRRLPTWGQLAVFALGGALGLWTLYYFAFLLVAVNLMVGAWWLLNRRTAAGGRWSFDQLRTWLGRWAAAQVAVLLLYAPWLPTAWRQATDPPVPPWRSFTGLGDLLVQTWSALSLGQSVQLEQVWPVLVLLAGLFVLGLLARPDRSQRPDRSGWLLAGYVFLPVLLIYLASFVTPLFHVRYAFTYSTPFYVLVAAGLVWLGRRWRAASWLGLAILVAASGVSIYNYHADSRYAADDHRAAVHYLAGQWRPGDTILVNAGYSYTALLAYWPSTPAAGRDDLVWRGRLVEYEDQLPDGGPVVAQTGTVDGDPGLGWGDPASDFYAMSRAETEAALERLFARSYRVWVYRIYDTVTDPDGFIRDWLDEHSTKFEDQVFSGESQLRVQGYLGHRPPPAEVQSALEQDDYLELGEGLLRFWGMAPSRPRVEVGGCLDLAPYWQRMASLPEGPILFAGLEGSSLGPAAQTDERPLGSLLPVSAWPLGDVIRTPLRICIPSGTPPGDYPLSFGWYVFVDGQPVWLSPEGDFRLTGGDVEVVAPGDWAALPLPEVAFPAGVTLGSVRFLGFDAPSLAARPGDRLRLDLYWQALRDGPEQAVVVLLLADGQGAVVAEVSGPPAAGRAPFAGLAAGQIVHDPRLIDLPPDLEPGVYALALGRRLAGGAWLPVRRGVFDLGATYPLATIHVR